MKVIVAGVPKTGTKSVTAALKILGYEVYDFMENVYYLEKEWVEIFEKGFTTEKFYRMYKNVDATVDTPSCFFWEEIHQAFPDAKIILTMRDSEEVWVESIKHNMHILDTNIVVRILRIVAVLMGRKLERILNDSVMMGLNAKHSLWGRRSHLNESIAKMKYRAHNAYVIQKAPKDNLLVFNCKEGWEPMCKFLSVPIPDTPFPHLNVRSSVMQDTSRHTKVNQDYKEELMKDLVTLMAKFAFACFFVFVLARVFEWI